MESTDWHDAPIEVANQAILCSVDLSLAKKPSVVDIFHPLRFLVSCSPFANLLSVRRRDVDPGWMGRAKGLSAGVSGQAGVIRQVQVLPVGVPPNGKIEATVLR